MRSAPWCRLHSSTRLDDWSVQSLTSSSRDDVDDGSDKDDNRRLLRRLDDKLRRLCEYTRLSPEEQDLHEAAMKRVRIASVAPFSGTTDNDDDDRVHVEIFGLFTTLDVCVAEHLRNAKNDKNGVSKEGDVKRPIDVDDKEKSGKWTRTTNLLLRVVVGAVPDPRLFALDDPFVVAADPQMEERGNDD